MYGMVFKYVPKSWQVAVAKGVIKATIAVRQETVEFDAPEKFGDQKIKLGKGASITITGTEGTADKVQVSAGWGPTEQQMAAALAQGKIKSRDRMAGNGAGDQCGGEVGGDDWTGRRNGHQREECREIAVEDAVDSADRDGGGF